MNKIFLLGFVGQDPELKSSGNICTFSLATSEYFTDAGGEKQKRTTWHRVVAFKKLAGICAKYVNKGSQLLVEGKVQVRDYDKPDGSKAQSFEVVAMNVQFVGARPGEKNMSADDHPEIPF